MVLKSNFEIIFKMVWIGFEFFFSDFVWILCLVTINLEFRNTHICLLVTCEYPKFSEMASSHLCNAIKEDLKLELHKHLYAVV